MLRRSLRTSARKRSRRTGRGSRIPKGELGIKPTASYTSELMGNPGGRPIAGIHLRLEPCKFPSFGISPNSSISGACRSISVWHWPHGQKPFRQTLIGNKVWVESAYTAPGIGSNNLTLGQIYLQTIV